jgi:NodT family efflux transporter outer membrane factor (OMF) lipoprotein
MEKGMGRLEESSRFFEKKAGRPRRRKKLFLCWNRDIWAPVTQRKKVFLVLFFQKKNHLLFLACLTSCAPPLAAPDLRVKADAYVPKADNALFVNQPVPAAWWEIFGNSALDGLVETGLQASPTLAQADANLSQAVGNANAADGAFLPQIGINPNVTRAAYPTGPNGYPPYTIYSLAGTISYDPGLFGARHYTFANGAAQIAYGQAELEAARQSLSGNIVSAAISEAGYEAQIATTQNIIAVEGKLLTLLNGEFADGAIPRLSVLQQQSQIAATEATLYPLLTNAETMRDRVAVLTGQLPADLADTGVTLSGLGVPQNIPVTLPSSYLAGRPDLRAARATVAAQNAALGLAIAHLYPDLTLSAQGGYASQTVRTLFETDAGLWQLAANLLAPLYDGGVLHARKQVAQAQLAAALAGYRGAVLNAFGEAADALQATQNDEAALRRAQAASDIAGQAYQLAAQQYALGAVDYTTVLAAQTTASQQALVLVQTRTALLVEVARWQSAMAD